MVAIALEIPVAGSQPGKKSKYRHTGDEVLERDLTRVVDSGKVTAILERRAYQPVRVERPDLQQAVDGVISSVGPVSVLITCRVNDSDMEIQLPTALVPKELQSFGQTVSVSLDSVAGYRGPRVVAREVPEHVDAEIEELEAWLASR